MPDSISVLNSAGTPVTVATNDAVITQLVAMLAKIIAAPATEAKQDTGNTSLASILAKMLAAPATEAKQDTGNTSLASILAKIIAAPATEAKQDLGNTSLTTIAGKDFATQTTVAAILAKLISAPATEAKQDTQVTALGTLLSGIVLAAGSNTIGAVRVAVSASSTDATKAQGTKAVTTAGTPVLLVASQTLVESVEIFARKNPTTANTGNVYVGFSSSGGSNYRVLEPGESLTLSAPAGKKLDLNTIYVDAATSADAVTYTSLN